MPGSFGPSRCGCYISDLDCEAWSHQLSDISMIRKPNSDVKEVDLSGVDIAKYVTSANHTDGDSVVIKSVWGDECYVSSWHLAPEKELYFVRKAIGEGRLLV